MDEEGDGVPLGSTSVANGVALTEAEQAPLTKAKQLTFKKGLDYHSNIELKMIPEFKKDVKA